MEMSRTSAHVQTFVGEFIGHGLYCATTDVLQTMLSADPHEPWDIYYERATRADGRDPSDVAQRCAHAPEGGYVYVNSSKGTWWPIAFCRQCMVIHGPHTVDEIDQYLGPRWPKSGEPPIDSTATEVDLLALPAASSDIKETELTIEEVATIKEVAG
jgi:hypothetical protein